MFGIQCGVLFEGGTPSGIGIQMSSINASLDEFATSTQGNSVDAAPSAHMSVAEACFTGIAISSAQVLRNFLFRMLNSLNLSCSGGL